MHALFNNYNGNIVPVVTPKQAWKTPDLSFFWLGGKAAMACGWLVATCRMDIVVASWKKDLLFPIVHVLFVLDPILPPDREKLHVGHL